MLTCRICLEEEPPSPDMISPCLCAGSSQYVHRQCLDQWHKEPIANKDKCNQCNTKYIKDHTPYGFLKNLTLFQSMCLGFIIGNLCILFLRVRETRSEIYTFTLYTEDPVTNYMLAKINFIGEAVNTVCDFVVTIGVVFTFPFFFVCTLGSFDSWEWLTPNGRLHMREIDIVASYFFHYLIGLILISWFLFRLNKIVESLNSPKIMNYPKEAQCSP
jgi:hypothetical protein